MRLAGVNVRLRVPWLAIIEMPVEREGYVRRIEPFLSFMLHGLLIHSWEVVVP